MSDVLPLATTSKPNCRSADSNWPRTWSSAATTATHTAAARAGIDEGCGVMRAPGSGAPGACAPHGSTDSRAPSTVSSKPSGAPTRRPTAREAHVVCSPEVYMAPSGAPTCGGPSPSLAIRGAPPLRAGAGEDHRSARATPLAMGCAFTALARRARPTRANRCTSASASATATRACGSASLAPAPPSFPSSRSSARAASVSASRPNIPAPPARRYARCTAVWCASSRPSTARAREAQLVHCVRQRFEELVAYRGEEGRDHVVSGAVSGGRVTHRWRQRRYRAAAMVPYSRAFRRVSIR
jgi:hypothetical protein